MPSPSSNRPLVVVGLAVAVAAQQYSATYTPGDLPATTEAGQTGTNICGTTDSQNSTCQTIYFNSLDDFCVWAPPEPDSQIGVTEEIEVAWCSAAGHGTRLIPNASITGAHFRRTPEYVEITGYGDMTQLNIAPNDGGGELDPHGATGEGNPIGGIVFSDAFTPGTVQQIHEWMNFMGPTEFCFRICNPASENAWLYCQHIYDEMGCYWVMPGIYNNGFDDCPMDADSPPGIVNWGQADASTFHQGDPVTPAAAAAPSSSSCTTLQSLDYGQVAPAVDGNGTVVTSTSAPPTSTSQSSSSAPTQSSLSASPTQTGTHSGARASRPLLIALIALLPLVITV